MSELAEKVQREAVETIAPVRHVVQNAARTVDRITTPVGHALPKPVGDALSSNPLQVMSEVLQVVGEGLRRGPLGLIDLDSVESLLPPSIGPTAVEDGPSGAFPTPTAPQLPSTPPAETLLGERASSEDGLAMDYLAGTGGVEPLLLEAPGATGNPTPVSDPPKVTVDIADASPSGTGEHTRHLAALDRNNPTHSPEGPQVAAPSASGGSSLVPIAALLALLALAAPATLRRLGRVPYLRAPTPFVCALERPG